MPYRYKIKNKPIITKQEITESDFLQDEVYEALVDIVRREAYSAVDKTNEL